jgi:protein ImuB
MRLGEALARCPSLRLVSPDPVGVAQEWERAICALESIGARVEPDEPGRAFFDATGLRRLHGGATGTAWIDGIVSAIRQALAVAVRIGAGPSRFCASVAAGRARSRHAAIVDGAADLASEPIAALRLRPQTAPLVDVLERLGLGTLGAVAAVGRARMADRFGRDGATAFDLALGRDDPLVPRRPGEAIHEALELPESASGPQLERAMGLLVDRLLARRERDGRTLRSIVMSARLVEGGTWRKQVVLRESCADPDRIRLALAPHIVLIPAPTDALGLCVESFGPPFAGQRGLFDDGSEQRRARLREAVAQARVAAGPDAALRVLEIDPGSRIPERRSMLTPFQP